MRIPIVKDGWPLIAGPVLLGALAWVVCDVFTLAACGGKIFAVGLIVSAFMLYFFRDPERRAPSDPNVLVAGADGLIRAVEVLPEEHFLKARTVRVSIFLSPLDVHVNRSPMAGRVTDLRYTPGQHLLTIQNASSERNEHSSILIEGEKSRCLVKQIVGPIVRRVVYWLTLDQRVERGERIGIMKFGSRLDMYFLESDVRVLVKKGDRVRAGETVVAEVTQGGKT